MEKQKGFGVIPVVAAVIVILAIGFVGWHTMHSNKTAKKNDATTTSPAPPPASPATNTSPTQSPTSGYLIINEWGVKLPLTSGVYDAYYVVSTNNKDPNGDPNTMWLGLKSLDDSGCAAAQANTGGAYPLGALMRTAADATDPLSGEPVKQRYPNGAVVGNYYYAFNDGTNGKTCASQETLQSVSAAFATAAKNITAN
jgi:hypothetical protein